MKTMTLLLPKRSFKYLKRFKRYLQSKNRWRTSFFISEKNNNRRMKIMDETLAELVSVADFEKAALAKLAPETGEYYKGGSDDEVTLKENSAAFLRWKILPRYLIDVSTISVETTVLGKPVSIPFGISPTAFQKVAHPKGEVAMAKAAARAGTIYCQSLLSTTSFEEGAAAAPNGRRWVQIYILKDRAATETLIRKAEKAGMEALVVTIDASYYGKRRACLRKPFEFPSHLGIPNVDPSMRDLTYKKVVKWADVCENSATWEDIKWLKRITSLPLILKGILTAEDAALACATGVDAVWVSNHGGRQLDTVVSTISALPSVVTAVAGRCEIYLDGGINRGTDILKALALGANMVFAGRAPIWGLTVGGEDGVVKVLGILNEELQLSMGLSGNPDVRQLHKSMLIHEHK